MASCSPSALLESAKCFSCLGPKELQMVIAQLLCDIQAAGGGGSCVNLEGVSDDPTGVETPTFIGQVYVGPNTVWQATGLTSADWTEICSSLPSSELVIISDTLDRFSLTLGDDYTSISFPNLAGTISSLVMNQNTGLASISAPLLTNIVENCYLSNNDMVSLNLDSLVTVGGDLDFTSLVMISMSFPALTDVGLGLFGNSPNLTTISFPLLATVSGNLDFVGSGLTAASFPSLITVTVDMKFSSCVSLVTFSAPVWVPTNSTNILFDVCALDAASVNHILARCVAAGVTTCIIDLSGGTNAAPSGQGILDKAALILAGNTVTTN